MFDFRYHIASLIAVFIALVIGILVGIGLSGRGFVSDAERRNLELSISGLRNERDADRAALTLATGRQATADSYLADTYPTLVAGRLRGLRIAVVSVGSVDQTIDRALTQAVREVESTLRFPKSTLGDSITSLAKIAHDFLLQLGIQVSSKQIELQVLEIRTDDFRQHLASPNLLSTIHKNVCDGTAELR